MHLTAAMGEDAHLFPIRTATDWERWDRDSNLGQSTYRGENPEEGAYIDYWLASEAAALVATAGGTAAKASPAANGGGGDEHGGRRDDDAAGVVIRITDERGRLVKEFTDEDAAAGVNRAVWDLTWEGPEPIRGEEEEGGRGWWRGPSGPPAAPGTYTATIVAAGRELSRTFEVRGDPAVEATPAELTARLEASLRVRELQSRLNSMISALVDLNGQVEGVGKAIRGKDVANADRIRALLDEARSQIAALENDLRRPPPRMGYRQYPRLSEQLSFVARGINGAQARPTEAQLQVVTEIESEGNRKAEELQRLLDTTIAELNALLADQPKILTGWSMPRLISVRGGS